MEYIKPIIDTSRYEKLVDDIFRLGRNLVLRLNVVLSKYNDKYGKENYHQEFEYYSKNTRQYAITLRRSFSYYLTIENMRVDDDTPIKQMIMITVNDIIGIRSFVSDIMKWFESSEYDGLYATKNNNLFLTRQVSPIYIDLPSKSYLAAEPMIYVNNFNEKSPGVRLYLSSDTYYTEISLRNMRGFQYLIFSINMYESACNLINYLQRPDLGTNLISFARTPNNSLNPEIAVPPQIEGRKIQNKKKTLSDLD